MWSGGGEETRRVAVCAQTHHWGQLDRYLGKGRSGKKVRQEGLTPSPSEVNTPSDKKADEEEDVGEPVGHHERCFIPRISLCDLMDLFRFFILFLCHGCVKSFVQFMLSTRSLGCSANILVPNHGIYIHLYSPQVSPSKEEEDWIFAELAGPWSWWRGDIGQRPCSLD